MLAVQEVCFFNKIKDSLPSKFPTTGFCTVHCIHFFISVYTLHWDCVMKHLCDDLRALKLQKCSKWDVLSQSVIDMVFHTNIISWTQSQETVIFLTFDISRNSSVKLNDHKGHNRKFHTHNSLWSTEQGFIKPFPFTEHVSSEVMF
jgi:hypothetical protein